jgi:hypothetical protein
VISSAQSTIPLPKLGEGKPFAERQGEGGGTKSSLGNFFSFEKLKANPRDTEYNSLRANHFLHFGRLYMFSKLKNPKRESEYTEDGRTRWKYVILAIIPGLALLFVPRGILIDYSPTVERGFEKILIYVGIPLLIWLFTRKDIVTWQLTLMGALMWLLNIILGYDSEFSIITVYIYFYFLIFLSYLGIVGAIFIGWRLFREKASYQRITCFFIATGLIGFFWWASFDILGLILSLLPVIVVAYRWRKTMGINASLLITSILSASISSIPNYSISNKIGLNAVPPPNPPIPPTFLDQAFFHLIFDLTPIIGLVILLPIGFLRARTEKGKIHWLLWTSSFVVILCTSLRFTYLRPYYGNFEVNLWITGVGYIVLLMLPVVFAVVAYSDSSERREEKVASS